MQGSDSTIIAIFVVSALIVLILVGIIIAFVLLYQRRVLQQRMSLQELEVALQKELLAATLAGQEAERSRIAKDLHDSVGVMLSTLQLVIKRYGSRGVSPEQKADMVAQSTAIIDSTITTVRRISHDLLPPELELLGLWAALEQAAWRINEVGGVQVCLQLPENLRRLPAGHEIILYRIVQELLNNTLKHSGGTACTVCVEWRGESLVLRYSDNGQGIPPELVGPGRKVSGGLGLRSIETRAHGLGGSVLWNSRTESAGMSVEIIFSLPPSQQQLSDNTHEKN